VDASARPAGGDHRRACPATLKQTWRAQHLRMRLRSQSRGGDLPQTRGGDLPQTPGLPRRHQARCRSSRRALSPVAKTQCPVVSASREARAPLSSKYDSNSGNPGIWGLGEISHLPVSSACFLGRATFPVFTLCGAGPRTLGSLDMPAECLWNHAVRHGLTELEALMRCLHWLWTQHQQADSDTSAAHVMPTKQEVEIVLRELHAEWERRSVASCHGDTVPVAVQAPISNPAPTEAPSLQPLAGTGDSNNATDNKNGPGMAAAASHAVAVGGVEDMPPAGASAGTSCVSVSAQAAQPPPRKRARKASRYALVVAPASIGLPSGSLGPVVVADAGSSSAPVPARAADEQDLDMPLMTLVSRGRGRGRPRGRGRGGRARSTTTLAHQPPPPAGSSPSRPASLESPGQRLLSSSSSSSSSSS
jgi:hypothetical protein